MLVRSLIVVVFRSAQLVALFVKVKQVCFKQRIISNFPFHKENKGQYIFPGIVINFATRVVKPRNLTERKAVKHFSYLF